MNKISTEHAPAAIGPYSQAVVYGQTVYTSGQIAINPATQQVEEDTIEGQTLQVMKNIGAILEAAGSNYQQVIKTTCFLADMKDFAAFNKIYETYFTEKPARSCVAVKELPKQVLCEVEVIAYIA